MKTTIDNDKPLQVLNGPGGITLTLDAKEIYPDDPGQGAPMLLQLKRETMTLHCAVDNAPDMGANGMQHDWICGIYDAACAWLDVQCARVKVTA